MGSSTINTPIMAEDKKKSIKGLIKNIFSKKKGKDNDNKENVIHKCETVKEKAPEKIEVNTLIQNFKKIEIEKKKEARQKEEDDELKNFSFKTVNENELDNFTYNVVEDDRRTERTDSHSSQDSGYSEKDLDASSEDVTRSDDDVIDELDDSERKTKENSKQNGDAESQNGGATQDGDEKTDEIADSLQSLKLEDSKKKKCHLVPVSRGPVRNRVGDISGTFHPYVVDTQINTVNKQTFSGGQVIVANRVQEFTEVQVPLEKDEGAEDLQCFDDGLMLHGVQFNQPFDLDLVQEYIDEKNSTTDSDTILQDFFNQSSPETIETLTNLVQNHIENGHNPIEELEHTNHLNYEKIETLDTLLGLEQEDRLYANIFPTPPSSDAIHSPPSNEFYTNLLTPPRSETIPSPMSETSIYPTNSEYTLSPNSDCEKYQDIPQFYDELPNAPEEFSNEKEDGDKKARERITSTSSLSMKNFKDMQKELAASFSKKECCKIERKSCKELFLVHMKKLKAEERKNLCFKVASMDLKTCNGVLHQILVGLSRVDVDVGVDVDVDLHMALFALICEKVLGTRPELFVDDFGLELLKAAAMRCPQRPLLTRLVVHCVRTAAAAGAGAARPGPKEALFKEVDALGDTLVTALARGGEPYAPALADILRAPPGHAPLFNVQHVNTEGYSALHVACREHSALSPRLHTVHALLEHGGADIWKGDVKGGDTAVHMAVNSATCDLPLVLLLFKHLDRKEWKKLAHAPNRSSVTPLDYARCAVKSTTRQTYPSEVLDFLKKCR